ncbi:hypothetical protein AB1E19_009231 [Capra hircus]
MTSTAGLKRRGKVMEEIERLLSGRRPDSHQHQVLFSLMLIQEKVESLHEEEEARPCGRLVLRADLGQGCQPGSDTCRRTRSTSLGSSSVQWVSSGTGARAAMQVPGLEPAGAVPTGRSGPAWSAGQREHPGSRKERQGEHGTRGHPPSTLRAVHVQRRSPTSYQLPGSPSLAVASGAQCPLTGVYPRGLSEACHAEGSHVGLHKPLPRERQDVARRALCRRPSSVSITTAGSPALFLWRKYARRRASPAPQRARGGPRRVSESPPAPRPAPARPSGRARSRPGRRGGRRAGARGAGRGAGGAGTCSPRATASPGRPRRGPGRGLRLPPGAAAQRMSPARLRRVYYAAGAGEPKRSRPRGPGGDGRRSRRGQVLPGWAQTWNVAPQREAQRKPGPP